LQEGRYVPHYGLVHRRVGEEVVKRNNPKRKVDIERSETEPQRQIKRLSYPQLLALHVAANSPLQRSSMGWWAESQGDDHVLRIHSPATIKSLVKMGLLDGNERAKNVALRNLDNKCTMIPPIPKLWATELAKQLLTEITEETGLTIHFMVSSFAAMEPT
jgi:hypothetical protein